MLLEVSQPCRRAVGDHQRERSIQPATQYRRHRPWFLQESRRQARQRPIPDCTACDNRLIHQHSPERLCALDPQPTVRRLVSELGSTSEDRGYSWPNGLRQGARQPDQRGDQHDLPLALDYIDDR